MSLFERFKKSEPLQPAAEVRVEFSTASEAERKAALTEARDEYQCSKGDLDSYIERRHGPSPLDDVDLAPPTVCPNCGTAFDQPVSRSKKCPECREKIVIRTIEGGKTALTETQAGALDDRKKLVAAYRSAFRRVQNLGIGVEEFVATVDELGPEYSPRDASWRILNDRSISAMRDGDFHALAMAYHLQAIQMRDEGRDPNPSLGFAREAELLHYRGEEVVKSVVINGCDCTACAPDHGRELQWDEFVPGTFGPAGPLPHVECDRGLCPCSYSAVTHSFEDLIG